MQYRARPARHFIYIVLTWSILQGLQVHRHQNIHTFMPKLLLLGHLHSQLQLLLMLIPIPVGISNSSTYYRSSICYKFCAIQEI